MVPTISRAVDRTSFAAKEQRLSRDLVTLAALSNDMVAVPGDTWGWFSDAGWFRTTSLFTYNARLQESVATLAWFYTQQRPWNPYYGSQPLAERLLASLRYYLGLQHENGGFATNFPEQNHPATTGFGLGYLAVVYLLLDQSPLRLPGWRGAY